MRSRLPPEVADFPRPMPFSATEKPLVLVAEDEFVTRQAAIDMLREAGFAALTATNGTEAIRLLEDCREIRAVLTDIDMPGGPDGIRLAACIQHRRPDVHVIIVSGKVIPVEGDLPSGSLFFAKPYNESELIDALRGLLA